MLVLNWNMQALASQPIWETEQLSAISLPQPADVGVEKSKGFLIRTVCKIENSKISKFCKSIILGVWFACLPLKN